MAVPKHQMNMVKWDKDNENNDVKRKTKSTVRDRGSQYHRQESVWERLSRVKRTSSNEGYSSAVTVRSRSNIPVKSSNCTPHGIRLDANNNNNNIGSYMSKRVVAGGVGTSGVVTGRVATGGAGVGASSTANSVAARKIKLAKAIVMPDEERKSFVYLCKPVKQVKDLLTVRTVNASSEDSKYKDMLPSFDLALYPSTDDLDSPTKSTNTSTTEEFELAPLMPSSSSTTTSIITSAKICTNFRELLNKNQHDMSAEEINIIKDVVKTDNRVQQLDCNEVDDKLFKDILKSQLEEILKQESVVKSALTKLESVQDCLQKKDSNSVNFMARECGLVLSDLTGSKRLKLSPEEKQRLEIDLVFKNVPTLEKEIQILKTLGEQLQTALQCTLAQRQKCINETDCETLSGSTEFDSFGLNEVQYCPFEDRSQTAQQEADIVGLQFRFGFIKEFIIAQKTLNELKDDVNEPFFIMDNKDRMELKRTTFNKLKENPDELLSHLKPRNSMVTFNILEQDPIFFNNMIFSNSGMNAYSTVEKNGSATSTERFVLCEGGDSEVHANISGSSHIYHESQSMPQFSAKERNTRSSITLSLDQYKSLLVNQSSREYVPSSSNRSFKQFYELAVDESLPLERHPPIRESSSTEVIESKSIEPQLAVVMPSNPKSKKPLVPKNSVKTKPKNVQKTSLDSKLSKSSSTEPSARNSRRAIRRMLSPVPSKQSVQPKNTLLKTVLVGLAQISVFLLLIMAFTYPDIRC